MDTLAFISRYEAILKEKKIPKMQFYKDCGITDAAVSQWRKGKTNPAASTADRIAEYLGTTYEYLITGKGIKEKPTLSGEQISEARKQLYAALDDMTDEELLFLMSKIKAIKEMRK